MKVFLPANVQSVEKPIRFMRRPAAMGADARTDSANRGPRINSAPFCIAFWVALRAPSAVPCVSSGMSSKPGALMSKSASCAAFSMD